TAQLAHQRHRPLWANAAFAALFHIDSVAAVLTEDSLIELFDEGTRAEPEAAWRRLEAEGPIYGRRTFRRRDGAALRVEMHARRVLWDGAPAVLVNLHDVSQEEHAVIELAEARAEADAAARAHRRLLLATAEDLRPAILDAAAQLDCMPHNATVAEAASACRRLNARIGDILAAANEEPMGAPVRRPFDPREVLREAEACALGAGRAALTLSGPNGARLIGDAQRVTALARALIGAGAARTADAAIACEAEYGANGLSISVRTSGAPPALKRDDRLRVARALTEAMGGALLERSERGEWRASAYLPLPLAPERARRACDILIIDDHAGARRVLSAVVEALGHRPQATASGAEGIAAALARPYDLVICDINMPDMDGLQTARRIRALPRPWAGLPIAALSASMGEGVQIAVSEAGMDAFLAKPVSVRRLAETIALLTEPDAARGSIDAAEIQQVQEEHDHEEPSNCIDRDHEIPAPRLSFSGL
ncbi:MAG: response regulator, partial [Hyphomonadaceae bacterium]